MIRLSEKTIKALTWLRDNVDKVMRFAKDFDRVANKLDRIKGAGDVQVFNSPEGLVIGANAARRFVLGGGANALYIVKVVSNASGGGKYVGRMWQAPTADIAATGNLSATELGTDPGSDDCRVLNMQELGQSTHDLTTGTPKATHFLGLLIHVNSDGTKVVAVNGTDWEACT